MPTLYMNALKCDSPSSVTVSMLKFRLIRLTNIIMKIIILADVYWKLKL